MKTTIIANIPGDGQELIQTIRNQGGTVAFEGSFDNQEPSEDGVEITLHYDDNDALPLFLCKNETKTRETSTKEIDAIGKEGSVTHVHLTHPRGDRYGIPISAACVPELWMGLVGNLGFKPSSKIELEVEDTQDDSTGHYILTVMVPKALAEKIEATSQAVRKAANDRLAFDETETGEEERNNRIANILDSHSEKTDEELEEEIKSLRQTFERNGGRGVDLADEIDELEALAVMRSTLKKMA